MIKIVNGKKVKQNIENKNHYFSTPEYIADIMADEFVSIYDGTSKILDIGCGKMELTNVLIRKGVNKDNITLLDLEKMLDDTKGIRFIQEDFFQLDLSEFQFFITNPPYKNGLHKKILQKCVDNKLQGVFIAPNMTYHNVKCQISKFISKEIWSDNFRKDFSLPSTQISIFTVIDEECNDGEKLKEKYFGEGYDLFKNNYPKCSKSIKELPIYTGQPNSLIMNPNNIWAAPAEFHGDNASFIYDRAEKDESLIYHTRSGAYWKKGDLRKYPCVQYKNDEEKQKILEFYKPYYDTFRKFIVIDEGRFIPYPPEEIFLT